MEFFLDLVEVYGKSVIVIASAFTIVAMLFALFYRSFIAMFRKSKTRLDAESRVPHTPLEPVVTMTLKDFEVRLEAKAKQAADQLQNAHAEDRARLQSQLNDLGRQMANPEQALLDAVERIADLEQALERVGNAAGGEELHAARAALNSGDASIADALFAKIEAREAMAVESAARAAFARGEIAEGDIRWADAARHYTRAAHLDPTMERLLKAREYLWRMGEFQKAISLGEELVDFARQDGDPRQLSHAMNEHAMSLKSVKRYDESETLHRQALALREKEFGANDEICYESLSNLGALLRDTGKYTEAEPLFRRALEICAATMGMAHPDYASIKNNLARLYMLTGRHAEADPLVRDAMKIRKSALGENHPDYALSLNNLALLYRDMKRVSDAIPLMEQALVIRESRLGPHHSDTVLSRNVLAEMRVG